jgi:integrase/recombinase XerD
MILKMPDAVRNPGLTCWFVEPSYGIEP